MRLDLSEQDLDEMREKVKELLKIIAKPLCLYLYNDPACKNFFKAQFVEEEGLYNFEVILKTSNYDNSIMCPCCNTQIIHRNKE